jgi:hypothetical protein
MRPSAIGGPSYFVGCIGASSHEPALWGGHEASHHLRVREAYVEAKAMLPKAADVIAALVWRNNISDNRADHFRTLACDALEASGRE